MGKIFYIFGKSSSGKDTIYNRLLSDKELLLKSVILYTTRPKRDGEKDGETYHFTDESGYNRLLLEGKIIESRAYDTMHGLWRYFTVKDEDIDPEKNNYLITGVLESFISTRDYFGKEVVIPIYIEVDDGIRLKRALERELKPENRKFSEMCRRYLSDTEDFSEDKLKAAGIDKRYINNDLEECINEIKELIRSEEGSDK
ncbi:MAG: guanylate kinase [Lachnospiraceae bacterium]|nr:guanylate kinase [Lachnospiraceae bacterium]